MEIALPGHFVPVVGRRPRKGDFRQRYSCRLKSSSLGTSCQLSAFADILRSAKPITGRRPRKGDFGQRYSRRLKSSSLGTSCQLSAFADILRSAKPITGRRPRMGDFGQRRDPVGEGRPKACGPKRYEGRIRTRLPDWAGALTPPLPPGSLLALNHSCPSPARLRRQERGGEVKGFCGGR